MKMIIFSKEKSMEMLHKSTKFIAFMLHLLEVWICNRFSKLTSSVNAIMFTDSSLWLSTIPLGAHIQEVFHPFYVWEVCFQDLRHHQYHQSTSLERKPDVKDSLNQQTRNWQDRSFTLQKYLRYWSIICSWPKSSKEIQSCSEFKNIKTGK